MSPTLQQLEDWNRRIFKLVNEAENAYGEPSPGMNQTPLDMAIHIASHLCVLELREARASEARGVPS